MKVEIIFTSIFTIITEIILYRPMEIVWNGLYQAINDIGTIVEVELPLTWHIAFKILEVGGIFLFILTIVISVRNIIFSDRPINPP